jgi:hypothetical protein
MTEPKKSDQAKRDDSGSTKKVVINACFGGFSLSPRGVKRLAKLQGRKCYIFSKPDFNGPYVGPLTPAEADKAFMFYAFDIPNPNEVLADGKTWQEQSDEERRAANALYEKHSLDNRPEKRDDPLLVQVVEELDGKSWGSCAELKVVEVPVDVDFIIEEYDGNEHIAEKHRTWD